MEINLQTAPESERIHILGVGNIGRLFAHALSKEKNRPPITLLLHRANLLHEFENMSRAIQIKTDGVADRSGGYDAEVILEKGFHNGPLIKNLIVPTKTFYTVAALSSVKQRLSSQSTILFAQNGLGTMEQVTKEVFPDSWKRPSYLACVMHHGVYSEGPFRSVHAGRANMTIGRVEGSQAPQYLIDRIVHASLLFATEVSSSELLNLQLEKLVINSIINPLTVIFSCRNGILFDSWPVVKLMRSLLLETSQIIQRLPQFSNNPDPGNVSRFSPRTLEVKVLEAAEKTAGNTSSMLQDFRAGRETEIGFINGYIVARGREMEVDVEMNERVVAMVREGVQISVDEVDEHFPELEHKLRSGLII